MKAMRIGVVAAMTAGLACAGEVVPEGPDDVAEDGEEEWAGAVATAGNGGSLAGLAQELSRDAGWLTPTVLEAMRARAVELDEIFADAPRFMQVAPDDYRRLTVQATDGDWSSFDPAADDFAVFVDPHVLAPGPDGKVVGYRAGVDADFHIDLGADGRLVEIALAGVDNRVQPGDVRVQTLDQRISIAQRLEAETLRNTPPDVSYAIRYLHSAPHCPAATCDANEDLYFVVDDIKVKDDREGCCFKGAPEIEMMVVKPDPALTWGGAEKPKTQLIFDGRFVVDASGRSAYLPDIDDGIWYSNLNLALFPMDQATNWFAMLIEDDNTKGELLVPGTQWVNLRLARVQMPYRPCGPGESNALCGNGGSCCGMINFNTQFQVRQLHWLESLRGAVQDLINAIFNQPDDIYLGGTPGVEATAYAKICGEGQAWNTKLVFDYTDWTLQGHFACIERYDTCGNGSCNYADGENCDSCPQDCGACCQPGYCPVCGDGVCDWLEQSSELYSYQCWSDCGCSQYAGYWCESEYDCGNGGWCNSWNQCECGG